MNKKIKGSKNLNVPNKGEQSQTCLSYADRAEHLHKENVPNLRFPEFSGEWEKTTLGKIGETFNGLTGKSGSDFGQGSPYITYKSIFDNSKIDLSRVEYVTITDAERKKQTQNEVHYGDIFFTTSSETPDEVGMTSVLLDEVKNCYLNSFCFGYRLNSITDVLPEYMRFYLRSNTIRRRLFVLAQGSTRFNISKGEVMGLTIKLPGTAEQRKIAQLLTMIEDRIATQIKIIEDLKKLKSAICDKYFTYGNSIRLGDIGSFVRGLTYSSADIVDNNIGTAVLRSNNISNGEKVNLNELVWVNKTPGKDQLLKKNDIVICMANGSSSLVGKNSYYSDSEITSATVGAFCGIYRSNHPIAKWLLQSKHYKKSIHQSLQGGNGAIANVYPEDILSICFDIPCDNHIYSDMLENLECKLELEKSALGKLKSLKQYLLSQMFI